MDRTFDFGAFQIKSVVKGLVDDQPASQVFVIVPAGQADLGLHAHLLPLASEAALDAVRNLRKVLQIGPQRYVQFRMMREKRKPDELPEVQRDASRLFAVAKGIPGGDAALAQAEERLAQGFEQEKALLEAEAKKTVDEIEAQRTVAFDLGPVRMTVRFEGTMPGVEGDLAAFRIRAETPGVEPAETTVATNAPLFSQAAEWMLAEIDKVMAGGPEAYVERERERFKALEETGVGQATSEEALGFARALFAIGSAMGPAGAAHARQVLEQAKAQEQSDAEEAEIRRLEQELAEVRRRIDRMKRRKRRPQ